MRIKEKENKKRIVCKSWLIVAGSFLFILGSGLLSFEYIHITQEKKQEKAIEEFISQMEKEKKIDTSKSIVEKKEETKKNTPKYDYIAVLKIPKINLEKGLVSKKSKYNNVDYGIQILDESDSPDVINGNVILAGHSGTANISYFKNLNKLNVGDEAQLIYNGVTYNYKFVKIYDIEKTGKARIKRDKNTSTLTLITCRHGTNKQIVLIAELQ